MKREKGLPKSWPKDWPQNEQEFRQYLKTSDRLRKYMEERGIELRYNEKTDKVIIKKLDQS